MTTITDSHALLTLPVHLACSCVARNTFVHEEQQVVSTAVDCAAMGTAVCLAALRWALQCVRLRCDGHCSVFGCAAMCTAVKSAARRWVLQCG